MVMVAVCCAADADAGSLPTQKEALTLAFPGATLTRKEHFLTPEQADKVKALSGVTLRGLWVVAYEAKKEGKPAGVGFFDTHIVRTQPETALVAVSPEGKVIRVEVIAFREPQDYQAPAAWVQQFEGKALNPGLSLKRDIRPLSGATLTANALTDAARRSLGLWQVLYGKASVSP
jgi:hypothetical protein